MTNGHLATLALRTVQYIGVAASITTMVPYPAIDPDAAVAEAVLFFFKQKTAYELGLGIPAEPLFRSFLTASKQFRHGATSKSRSNTASNSTKHKSPHLSGWRQIISLIT